jgi:hypothetical protein
MNAIANYFDYLFVVATVLAPLLMSAFALYLFGQFSSGSKPLNFSLAELIAAVTGLSPAAAFMAKAEQFGFGWILFGSLAAGGLAGMINGKLLYELKKSGATNPRFAAMSILSGAISGYVLALLGAFVGTQILLRLF